MGGGGEGRERGGDGRGSGIRGSLMRLSGAPMDPRHLSLVADGCQPVLCQPADIIGGRGEKSHER